MGNISLTKTWVDAEVLNASDLNTNFTDVTDVVNGNIETVNIKDSAVTADKIATGAVTTAKISNPYKMRATRTASQTITDNTTTKVQLNVETFDTNNNFDAATNFEYTVPITGYYQINAKATLYDENAKIVSVRMYVYKNGSAILQSAEIYTAAYNTAMANPVISDVCLLAAGDKIDLRIFADTSDNTGFVLPAATEAPYLSIHLLSV
jgi:hypothetical protein